MKLDPVIALLLTELQEVFTGLGGLCTIQIEQHGPKVGQNGDLPSILTTLDQLLILNPQLRFGQSLRLILRANLRRRRRETLRNLITRLHKTNLLRILLLDIPNSSPIFQKQLRIHTQEPSLLRLDIKRLEDILDQLGLAPLKIRGGRFRLTK